MQPGTRGKKLTIIYMCHYFAPEIGAPSARLLEMSREWVADGHTVKVVTCFPNHPTGVIPAPYRRRLFMKEMMDGIEVYRNWVYATPNRGVIKRTLGHLSFVLSSVLLSTRRVGRADVIIVSSPALLTGLAAWMMGRLKRLPYVFEVRDLWPAAIKELGVLTQPWIIRPLEAIEMRLYRDAAAIVTVARPYIDVLAGRGVPRAKMTTVSNGVDTEFFQPQPKETDFRRRHGLEHATVVLYSGAHGISHRLDNILEVARRCRHRPELRFLFVGEGADKPRLEQQAQEMGLTNVLFLPPVSKQEMPEVYASADICLVPLRDIPLFRTCIPSKIYEILACGRPIVASVAGEAARILEESGGGVVVAPEDVDAIEQAVCRLAVDEELRQQLAQRGVEYATQHCTRRTHASRYIGILRAVLAGASVYAVPERPRRAAGIAQPAEEALYAGRERGPHG